LFLLVFRVKNAMHSINSSVGFRRCGCDL
jgi:hypothetical protein